MRSQIILKYLNSTFPLPLTESALKQKKPNKYKNDSSHGTSCQAKKVQRISWETLFLGNIKSSFESY